MDGVHEAMTFSGKKPKRKTHSPAELVEGILAGNRTLLSKAITLIESNHPDHSESAREIVRQCLPHAGKSIRVGITGVPGVGKSTFIEALGSRLCTEDRKVAVLAVDPSSSVTGGSILGDKTRMENLSREPNAFIRPSPTGGNLGGVTRKSRETIVLCEAFGFDTLLIETVGVGQSETTVRSMVDFFLLLLVPNAGDELQGLKKGVVELADAIVVNKADGDNKTAAERARQDYQQALRYLSPATPGWAPQALSLSALTGDGIPELWEVIQSFQRDMSDQGTFTRRREQQRLDWMFAMAEDTVKDRFYRSPEVQQLIPEIRQQVIAGELPASAAAEELLKAYFNRG
jgi:LAO/AO transport system kinase